MAATLAWHLGRSLRGLRAGMAGLASRHDRVRSAPECIRVTSPALTPGTDIPPHFTGDGAGLFPPLEWQGVPVGTRSLALLVEDPDVPLPLPLAHGVAYGIPSDLAGLAEGALPTTPHAPGPSAFVLGRNSLGRLGWLPPSPPPGHGPHHYAFQVFALDNQPIWDRAAGRRALVQAMRGHLLGWGVLFAIYERG